MVYTSYFSSKKYNPSMGVSIARYAPFWKGTTYPNLYPPQQLLDGYKKGKINQEEFSKRYYKEVLSTLNPFQVYKDLDNKVLLCFEKSEDFCHRHLITKWLTSFGLRCEEI